MLTIRQADALDAETMFMIHKAAVYQFCASSYSPVHMQYWFEERTAAIYAPALEAKEIWVAVKSGRVVGFVGATRGEITLLFVLPDSNGQGIGTALFVHGLSVARGLSSDPVTVIATMNSESFYASQGFVTVEEQWFEREARSLRYPVLKMIERSTIAGSPQSTDA